ncbi:MAG: hypothetical protein HY848_04215 [Betaproteobacteria bacterium]|nr:hypothetical protein [Betaproteobacteria bacterium]
MYSTTSANAVERSLRAPRANLVFCADEKRIRAENKVIDKNKDYPGDYASVLSR